MMDVVKDDVTGIKCIECISVYDSNFDIQKIGISYNSGDA
tara:strand:- start:142 stop:261 length:120 start_codon:yes stop_codon:yes gene_type:complete